MLQNNTNELYHYGIPGQKWGIRRYQNKDGSLTPAGKKKAAKLEEKYKQVTGRNIRKQIAKKAKTAPKSIDELTNEELKSKTTRLKLENDYVREKNTYKDLHPKQVSKGKAIASHFMKNVLSPAATDAGKQVLTNWLKNKGNDLINSNVDEHTKLKREVENLRLQKDKLMYTKQIKNALDENKKKK